MKKAFFSFVVIFTLIFPYALVLNKIQKIWLLEKAMGMQPQYGVTRPMYHTAHQMTIGERGKQIGIVDGDKDNRVYELKGYSVDEWIVNSFPYDAAMLLREVNVTDIPDGWQSEYEWN